jgi:hypothetical protein
MNENLKYGSKLYHPDKPYYQMSIKELYQHHKICKSLDKTKYSKILRMEKWDAEKLKQKKEKFLNKHTIRKTKKNIVKNKTKRRNNIRRNKTREIKNKAQEKKKKIRKTRKIESI